MNNIYTAIATAAITISAMMFFDGNKAEIGVLESQIARNEMQLDSIKDVNVALIKELKMLDGEVIRLNTERDRLNKVISDKESDIENFKNKKNENGNTINSASDSDVIDILTKHEFKASKKV